MVVESYNAGYAKGFAECNEKFAAERGEGWTKRDEAAYNQGFERGHEQGFKAGVASVDTEPKPADPPPPGKRVLHLGKDDGALVCKTPGSVPYTHDETEATCKECLRASKDRQEGYTYDRT